MMCSCVRRFMDQLRPWDGVGLLVTGRMMLRNLLFSPTGINQRYRLLYLSSDLEDPAVKRTNQHDITTPKWIPSSDTKHSSSCHVWNHKVFTLLSWRHSHARKRSKTLRLLKKHRHLRFLKSFHKCLPTKGTCLSLLNNNTFFKKKKFNSPSYTGQSASNSEWTVAMETLTY